MASKAPGSAARRSDWVKRICTALCVGVCTGNAQGFHRDIHRVDFGLRKVLGERDGDGSGAGADTSGNAVRLRWDGYAGQDGFDEKLGFGARDEDCGGDGES